MRTDDTTTSGSTWHRKADGSGGTIVVTGSFVDAAQRAVEMEEPIDSWEHCKRMAARPSVLARIIRSDERGLVVRPMRRVGGLVTLASRQADTDGGDGRARGGAGPRDRGGAPGDRPVEGGTAGPVR